MRRLAQWRSEKVQRLIAGLVGCVGYKANASPTTNAQSNTLVATAADINVPPESRSFMLPTSRSMNI